MVVWSFVDRGEMNDLVHEQAVADQKVCHDAGGVICFTAGVGSRWMSETVTDTAEVRSIPGVPATTAKHRAWTSATPERSPSILNAEHASLVSSRSLAYNEGFVRTGMFLTALSAALVALGFVAQADPVGDSFRLFGVMVLALVSRPPRIMAISCSVISSCDAPDSSISFMKT